LKPKRLSRAVIYENPWVNLYIDKVQFPGGRIIEQHHILEFDKDTVAVVVENAEHQVLLIQAYRYTINSIDWEIPAGWIEPGESIIEAAKREVWEETGYETTNLEVTYTYNPLKGIAKQKFHIVKGQATKKTHDFDTNEVKAVKWVSRQEIMQKIAQMQLKDDFTLIGLLLCLFNDSLNTSALPGDKKGS